MELPSPDQQSTIYGILVLLITTVGGSLAAIAKALFALLKFFMDKKAEDAEKSKAEGIQEGIVITKLDRLDKDIVELKDDIDGIAKSLVRQGLSLQKKPKQTESPID